VSRAHAFAAAALATLALAAATSGALALAAATPGAPATTPAAATARSSLLSHARVRAIALRIAKLDGDSHPSQIALASGPLQKAVKVFDPHAHPTAAGLRALGGAKSIVDLVAMHGRFTSRGPHPRNRREPKGRVLELIFSAHSGTVFGVSLGPRLRVPLSRLGPVTALAPPSRRRTITKARAR
jgi:hypothetical protein